MNDRIRNPRHPTMSAEGMPYSVLILVVLRSYLPNAIHHRSAIAIYTGARGGRARGRPGAIGGPAVPTRTRNAGRDREYAPTI